MDARLIQHNIKAHGMDATFRLVSSRKDFEAALSEDEFDLVLVDFHLPDINALQAIQLLKENGINLPILLVSGLISGESAVEVVKAGASDYILKDHLPRLVPAIRRALDIHQREQRLKNHEEEIKKVNTILKQAESLGKLGAFEWQFINDQLTLTSGLNLILELDASNSHPRIWEILGFIVPEDLQELSEKVSQAIKQPGRKNLPFTEDFRIRTTGGIEKYVNSKGEILYDPSGSPIKMVGVIQDITKQKEAEAAIKKLNEELEQKVLDRTEELAKSEAQYRLISENISDLVIALGKSGKFEFVSRSVKSILGYEKDELLGVSSKDVVHPDDLTHLRKMFKSYLTKGKDEFSTEARLRHKKGHYVWVESNIKISTANGGASHRVQASCRDITRRMRMQREKEKAMEKEKKLAELQAQFVSIASHQFRTPLSIIRSNVELLEMMADKGKLPKKIDKFNKICLRLNSEIDHLTDLMDDILEMGRIEQGKITANLEEVDLVSLLKGVLTNEGKSITQERETIFEVEGKPTRIQVDPRLVTHVLINLLSNAFKYSPAAPSPELRLKFNRSQTTISVKDYGIGIPEAEQGRLFESWFRASNTNGIRGTGLGLGISKRFIEAMGGNLSFESKEGKGSTFYITFPNPKANTNGNTRKF